MLKSFKNGVVFGLGVLSVLGVVFAATSVIDPLINEKEKNGTVSFEEFNQILGTIRNIYNDNTNERIGINQETPEATLDINGNMRISKIISCDKLGTTNEGQLTCK